MLSLLTAAIFSLLAPEADAGVTQQQFERLQGFSTVLLNHVSKALGTDNLPNAVGLPVEPGVFVTVTADRVQIFDQDVVELSQGRLADTTAADECRSACPAAFFDAFQQSWLEAAIESTVHAVEIPQRVLIAAHSETPAQTMLALAYAAAESRPVSPPSMHLVVSSSRGGLRAQPFFLVPPQGLELRQGSAALGLTVKVSQGTYTVTATDPQFVREHRVRTPAELRRLLAEIKRRYPGKETVIIEPDQNTTVGDVMRGFVGIQSLFPRLVFSVGQPLRTP